MEAVPNSQELPDDELNAALESYAADELGGLSIKHQRLAKIIGYEESALAKSDPLSAMIGVGNADLQRIFEHLSAAVLEQLDHRAHTVDEFRELTPHVHLLAKLRHSIEVGIALQNSDSERQATAFPFRTMGDRLETKPAISKRDQLPKRWMSND